MHNIWLFVAALSQPNISPLPHVGANKDTATILFNIFFGVIGAICFLIMTIGGFKFITSKGDPQGVAKARKAITYALVGMAVSLSAVTIINFVLGRV